MSSQLHPPAPPPDVDVSSHPPAPPPDVDVSSHPPAPPPDVSSHPPAAAPVISSGGAGLPDIVPVVSPAVQTPPNQMEQLVDTLRSLIQHLEARNLNPRGVGGERSLMNEALAFVGGVGSFSLQMVAQPTDGVFTSVEARLHACYCKNAGETQICPSDCIPFTYIGFQLVTAFCFALCGCLMARVIWGSKKFRAWMLALLFVWTCGYLYTAFAQSPWQFRKFTVMAEAVAFVVVIAVMVFSRCMKMICSCCTDSPAVPV